MSDQFLDSDDFTHTEVMLPEWHTSPEVFSAYQVHVNKILRAVIELEVKDDSSCRAALNLSSDTKLITKDIASVKKNATDPYRQFINIMNESSKLITDKLDAIQDIISQKVDKYQTMLNSQAEMAQKSIEKDSEASEMYALMTSQNGKKISSTAKTIVSYKTDKEFSVTDINLVPREYFKLDEDKINKSIKMGVSQIPGIDIIDTKKLVLRRR